LIRGASTGGKSLTQECRPVFFDLRDAFSFSDRDWLGSHAAISTSRHRTQLSGARFMGFRIAIDQRLHGHCIDSESYSAVVLYCERCGDLESALPKSRGRKPKKPRAPTKGAPKQLIAHNAPKRELPIPAQTEQEPSISPQTAQREPSIPRQTLLQSILKWTMRSVKRAWVLLVT
jgi:hypothetical protein